MSTLTSESGALCRPNLFLVGAPRCGTTTLYRWLAAHPAIFMTSQKEQWYFSRDIPAGLANATKAVYLSQFAGASTEHQWVGEASTVYLFSTVALGEIQRFNPDARILVAVRNPLEMIPSFHQRLLVMGWEDEPDVAKAWEMQEARQDGEGVPAGCKHPRFLQYREVGRLGQQLERVYEYFPREQVHVVVMDDLRRDGLAVQQGIFDWLELEPEMVGGASASNPGRTPRQGLLGLGLQSAKPMLNRTRRDLRRIWPGMPHLGGWLSKAATRAQPRQPLDENLKRRLVADFTEDVRQLGTLLDRDLDHWLEC